MALLSPACSLILSWEQLNAGGGGGDMDLKVPTGGKVERRQSQEFRNLCVKFDEKEGGGVGNDVRRKPESNPSRGLNCSFANVTGPSPGPSQGRGHKEN